jgi:hypothetical protein
MGVEREPSFREMLVGAGDCLQEQVVQAAQDIATPEQVNRLRDRRTDVRTDYGQLICEAADCVASCVVSIDDENRLLIDFDELGVLSNSCTKLSRAGEWDL